MESAEVLVIACLRAKRGEKKGGKPMKSELGTTPDPKKKKTPFTIRRTWDSQQPGGG